MYNSKKKRSYTCITRKKDWSHTCIARKNGVIHSYTFLYISSFSQVLGQRFLKVHSFCWLLFHQKNAAPWAAIVEIKQFTYVIIWDSKFGRRGTMGRSDSYRRGCTSHKPRFFLGTPSSLKSVHRSHFCWCCQIMAYFYYNRSGSLSRYYTHQDQ